MVVGNKIGTTVYVHEHVDVDGFSYSMMKSVNRKSLRSSAFEIRFC